MIQEVFLYQASYLRQPFLLIRSDNRQDTMEMGRVILLEPRRAGQRIGKAEASAEYTAAFAEFVLARFST